MTDWDPAQYERFKAQRSQPFWDLIDLVQPVRIERAVDLGCGTGELTDELHRPFVDAYRDELLARIGDHEPYLFAFKRILMWGRVE